MLADLVGRQALAVAAAAEAHQRHVLPARRAAAALFLLDAMVPTMGSPATTPRSARGRAPGAVQSSLRSPWRHHEEEADAGDAPEGGCGAVADDGSGLADAGPAPGARGAWRSALRTAECFL